MNENRGAKGGVNDVKRTNVIIENNKSKEQEKEEQEEIKRLELENRKKHFFASSIAIPIVVTATVVDTLLNIEHEEATSPLILPTKRGEILSEDDLLRQKYELKGIDITTSSFFNSLIHSDKKVDLEVISHTYPYDKIEIIGVDTSKEHLEKPPIPLQSVEIVEQTKIEIPTTEIENKKEQNINIEEEKHQNKYSTVVSDINAEELTPFQRKELEKLKSKKIVEEYELKLKDIRKELRDNVFEYNSIVKESSELYDSETAEKLLDQLNELIKKIEKLKEQIKIENLNSYDDNYIYVLIENYLEEFKNGNIIKEIEDSPLYIEVARILETFDEKKDKLTDEIEKSKEQLEIKEERLDELKEKYFKVEEFNKQLKEFQALQAAAAEKSLTDVRNAVTEADRVQAQTVGMNNQMNNLLRFMALQMARPGIRSGRAMTMAVALTVYFIRNMINPPVQTRPYREVQVQDYSKEIEQSIGSIEDVLNKISIGIKYLDKIYDEITTEFSELIGHSKELDELISNLKKVKEDLKEKEYEVEKTKQLQQEAMEINNNNARQLTR